MYSVGKTVNGWNGQYAKTKAVTQGKVEFDTQSWAVFFQDDMRLGRLKIRPGVRVDADDYMNKTTVARLYCKPIAEWPAPQIDTDVTWQEMGPLPDQRLADVLFQKSYLLMDSSLAVCL